MKKSIHDKKGGIGRANGVEEVEESELYGSHNYDITKMDSYLDNLAAAATQEKDFIDRLVNNNEKLITQLETLTAKFDQLSSNPNSISTSNSTIPMFNGKKPKFVQYEKDGCCHSHACKFIKGHNSKTCSNSSSKHQKEATQRDAKNGSSHNKNWTCSYYEENGFWVPIEQRNWPVEQHNIECNTVKCIKVKKI